MKIRCGTDIIEISRLKADIEKLENKFIQRIYTEREIEYCESKKKQKYQHYAARFAAKEAVFKAISKSLDNKYAISWQDIEIINGIDGRPIINMADKFTRDIESMDISISHCKEYACANVVILYK